MSWLPTAMLRADTESDMIAAFASAGLTVEDENGNEQIIASSQKHACILLGTLDAPTGKTLTDTDTGITYPEMAPVPGYHVNFRAKDQALYDALASVTINPSTPMFKTAGE